MASCLFSLNAQFGLPAGSSNGTAADKSVRLDDVYGRTTPRGTVLGLIRAVQKDDLARAANYLETRQTGAGAQELALQLKTVLDRRFYVPINDISDAEEGSLLDLEDASHERIGAVEGPKGQVAIILHRVKRGSDPPIWLFSSTTLARIPEVYADIDVNWLEQNLPEIFRSKRLFNVPLWRWLTFLFNIVAALASATLVTKAVNGLLRRAQQRYDPALGSISLFSLTGPLRLLFLALAFLMVAWFSSTLVSRNFWFSTAGVLSIIGFTWLTTRVADGIYETVERHHLRLAASGDMALRRLLLRLAKVLIVLVGFAALLRAFGKDPTTLLAGLGVGGIAIAFAAQKTLENLFGGVMLISDSPIKVGDFCAVGALQGTVEDIGLRSTRIRTLQRTVVSIPNGVLSAQNIENFALRDKFLFKPVLNLRYETTPSQLRAALASIQAMLKEHPEVEKESMRVRFINYGPSSLDLEIFAYVLAPNFAAFLEVQEQLLLGLMDIVVEQTAGFAFPSTTMYIASDTATPLETLRPQSGVAEERAGEEPSVS